MSADPALLATIHAECFETPRPWAAEEIVATLAQQGCFLLNVENGFLIGRAIAGEAELLTLAVRPSARRQGLGASLVAGFLDRSGAEGATRAFLEVAADNLPAQTLYSQAGFTKAGSRKGYYRNAAGTPVDAVIMVRDLG